MNSEGVLLLRLSPGVFILLGILSSISERHLHSIPNLCTVAASSLVMEFGIVICSQVVTRILNEPGVESGIQKLGECG